MGCLQLNYMCMYIFNYDKKKMLKILWFRCKINKYYVYTITFLPEVIVNDQINLSYITNGLQITDIFTKFLPTYRFPNIIVIIR